MIRGTFRGGIHPYDGKDLSKDKPIQAVLPPKELVYLLSQHIGAPAQPLVKKGERVLAGQVIAEASSMVSAPVHASVSGIVKGIEPRLTVSGAMGNAIVVENDGKYEEIKWPKRKAVKKLMGKEILQLIQEAGVVGMGGAGFPTHVKLSPKEPENIDYMIVNCAECEPYLTSDYRRMMEEPDKIVKGLVAALRLFPNARGVLAVEDNKSDAVKRLEEAAKAESRIEVQTLKTKYPQGAERQLIYAVTGRMIHSGMLPADAGCVVDNCETVYAIYRAVYEGRPLTRRIVTVTGDAIKEPQNFLAYIGTDFAGLVEAAGGFRTQPQKMIAGGPMMGTALYDLHIPVTKTSSAILCLTKDEAAEYEPSNCINCGRCVSVCPGRVVPARLADMAARHEEDAFVKADGMECCECGCCSYVCPAHRPLTQYIKSMRKIVLANRKRT